MKNGFFLVAITAILLTSTLASQVYGQSLQITVETDKDMYSPGETITVSGTINKITNNEVVTMKFVKSNGNLASISVNVVQKIDKTLLLQVQVCRPRTIIFWTKLIYAC